MPSVIEEFDQMFSAVDRWSKAMSVILTEDIKASVAATLMIYDIERRGWLNRTEELQRAQRIATAAKEAIAKELP